MDMEYVATGNRLYGDSPWTYIRCMEKGNDYQRCIGGFSAADLHISCLIWKPSTLEEGSSQSSTLSEFACKINCSFCTIGTYGGETCHP